MQSREPEQAEQPAEQPEHPEPVTLNGYHVVASHRLEGMGPSRVVLVDRGATSEERYVIAFHGDGEDGWWQGTYLRDFFAAVDNYRKRCGLDR